MNADLVQFLQIFSPALVVAAALWKIGHTVSLRLRQKSALIALCEAIDQVSSDEGTDQVSFKIERLKAQLAFYDRSVFGDNTPMSLVPEVVEAVALVSDMDGIWKAHTHRVLNGAQAPKEPFSNHRQRARELKSRARLVLLTLS